MLDQARCELRSGNLEEVRDLYKELHKLNLIPIELYRFEIEYFAKVNQHDRVKVAFTLYDSLVASKNEIKINDINKIHSSFLTLVESKNELLNKSIGFERSTHKAERVSSILIFVIVVIFLTLVLVVSFFSRKRIKNERRLIELEAKVTQDKLLEIESVLLMKEGELLNQQDKLRLKNSLIIELNRRNNLNEKYFPNKILTEEDWTNFLLYFEAIHPNLIDRFHDTFTGLTNGELRLMLLIKLNFDSRAIAEILGISKDSVQKSRTRLRKRMKLCRGENLVKAIQSVS